VRNTTVLLQRQLSWHLWWSNT